MSDKIVKHNWNGFEIRQAAGEFQMGDQLIPAGAVSLTDLCKINEKRPFEFMRMPSTIAFCEAFKSKYGIFPYLTTRGITGSTWVLLPLAMKACTWISPEFELWAMETLVKVVTGEEITNQDRAEGWARAESLGATPTLNEPENPFGRWTEAVSLVKAARVAEVEPERLIQIDRAINPIKSGPKSEKAASAKPIVAPLEDRAIVQEFLRNVLAGRWSEQHVRTVNARTGEYWAIYMAKVWQKYAQDFKPAFTQQQLRRAIDAIGGKADSVQKFPNVRGTMIGKCCVIIPIAIQS